MHRLIPLAVAAIPLLYFAPSFGQPGPGVMIVPSAPSSAPPMFVGTASCAAAACHNANGPRGAWRSEYTTWAAHDPHARAYEVLFNETSRRIIRNLGPGTEPAEKNALCLNCHVAADVADLGTTVRGRPRHERFAPEDGVGCEACHGAAEKWLSRHYEPGWRDLTPEQKAAYGMRNTKNLAWRADACAECHVGSGDRDVNHDLIAAGHPRLIFELNAYHARLPKHWDVRKDTQRYPDFNARLWAIGQAASSRAALGLLRHRAATESKPWPEFAEFDCFACHHDLADQAWRREPRRVAGRLGVPAWGTWYFALGNVLMSQNDSASLAELRRLMESHTSDRRDVEKAASRLARAFDPGAESQTVEWAKALDAKAGADLGALGWDGAAQLYLGLASQAPDAGRDGLLRRLRDLLEFPPGYDSPRGFDPQRPKKARE